MSLTSKQRAFLNSQAHTLKPIIQIGKNGLNDQIKTSVRQALDARELIKVTLLQNTDENIHEVAEILEEEMIKKYNSFYNGLNESINGKGNHLSKKFNTLGFKFSEDSKQKMKDNHWSKSGIESYWTGKNHSEETKEKISKSKSGIYYHKRKITIEQINEILNCYKNNIINFKNEKDLLLKLVKKSQYNLIENNIFNLEDLIAKNGKPITKSVLCSNYFAIKFNVTPIAIREIIKNDGKIAKDSKYIN